MLRDTSGNITIIFAFSLVPIFTAVGVSVDYGRAIYMKTQLQHALDSAVLAGGRQYQLTSNASEAEAAARGFFTYRFETGKLAVGNPQITSFSINTSQYKISATAGAQLPTPFLGIFGAPTIAISTGSQSALSLGGGPQDKDLEVALMLDITGSMNESTASGNSKIVDAKLAAKDLIDIIMPTGYSGERTQRVALIPFSQYVNVGNLYEDVTGQAPSGSNTCVTERTGPEAYTDVQPSANRWIGTFTPNSNHGTQNCAPAAAIIPLTTDKVRLKTSIDSYEAAGWTAGHLGTAWAWYALSHRWNSTWPNGSQPESPNPHRLKVAVLMTDGDYNTYYRNGTESRDQAAQLCNGMKTDITVYTIGFGTSMSSQTKDFLRACATSPQHYFDAQDGDQLRAAFRTIAFTLAQLRLTE